MYSKLYSSIILSSVWAEDNPTRILWITLLASADPEGYVFGAAVGLAHAARLSLDETKLALDRLESPDPQSADLVECPDNEGRRIETVAGGWRLINYARYRDRMTADDRRQSSRERQRAWRSRNVTENVTVTKKGDSYGMSLSESESESESRDESPSTETLPIASASETVSGEPGEASKKKRPGALARNRFAPPSHDEVTAYAGSLGFPGFDGGYFVAYYKARGWRYKGNVAMKDWKMAVVTWLKNAGRKDGEA